MHKRIVLVILAAIALLPAGCATGFRLGGDRYGVGAGGYVGPVPAAVSHHSYLLPPTP